MEAINLTVRGENADQVADAFVDAKAAEVRRSINKRGVRNVHRYDGDGFTQVVYERGSSYENSWLVVSVVVERVDEQESTVVLFVGGGGEGPFKMEEVTLRRIRQGEESVGQAGRFATVLRDLEAVFESLELTVTTEWESETESSMTRKIAREIFDS